jgi:hypothetical protein
MTFSGCSIYIQVVASIAKLLILLANFFYRNTVALSVHHFWLYKPGSNLVTIKSLSSSVVQSAKFPFANLLMISFDSGKCSKRDGSGLFPLLTIGLGCRNLLLIQNSQFHMAIVSPVVAAKFLQGFKCSQAASQHSFHVLFKTS